jgi:hypothetical protein
MISVVIDPEGHADWLYLMPKEHFMFAIFFSTNIAILTNTHSQTPPENHVAQFLERHLYIVHRFYDPRKHPRLPRFFYLQNHSVENNYQRRKFVKVYLHGSWGRVLMLGFALAFTWTLNA